MVENVYKWTNKDIYLGVVFNNKDLYLLNQYLPLRVPHLQPLCEHL